MDATTPTPTLPSEPAPTTSPRLDRMAGAHPPGRRSPKELLQASKAYQEESRGRSWFHVVETFGVFAALISALAWLPSGLATAFPAMVADGRHPVVVAVLATVLASVTGLVVVRMFILYHDYMHLAILRDSSLAKGLFYAYGIYVLTPPTVWRQTHNYHHGNTAKIVGSHVGSYLMVTTEMWKTMTPSERRMYKFLRHPANIFFAFFTVFGIGMCISPFRRNPSKNWDSALALVVHAGLVLSLVGTGNFYALVFLYFIPLFVACMAGAYLFYAQHDFPEMNVQSREAWEFTRAALESSSFMKLGPVMNWFTGNIGYHHVHHLNSGIPFYRLPEAMAGIEELKHPLGTTTLSVRDIRRCFEVKLWDAEKHCTVGYPEGT